MANTRFEIHVFDAAGRAKPVYEAYHVLAAAQRRADRIVGGEQFTGYVQVWEHEAGAPPLGDRDVPTIAYAIHAHPDVRALRDLRVWAQSNGMTSARFQQAMADWESGERAASFADYVTARTDSEVAGT
jgi:hypothetical protein